MRGVHELTRPEGDVRWKEGRLIHRDLLQACPELTRDMAKRSFMITVCYSAVNGGDSTERRGAAHGAPREDQIRMMKQRLGSGGGSGTGSKWSKLRDEGQKQAAAAAGAGAQGGSLLAKQPSQSFSNMVLRSNAGDQARRLLVNVALDEARLGRASFAGACPTFGVGGYGSLVNVATAASKGPVEHAATAAAAASSSSPTAAGNGGCACFVFVCGSVEEMKLVVQGLRVGIDHCHHHSTTNSDLHMPNHHFGALCLWERQRWWRRCFGGGGGSGGGSGSGSGGGDEEGYDTEWFSDGLRERHALAGSGDLFLKLYRPHYVHRLVPPPGRIHHGVVAEVPYADNSYELVLSHGPVLLPKGQSKNAEEELVLPLPCPIFKKGMYMRGRIVDYDWEEDSYDLLYCDGPFFGDDKPDAELQYLAMASHRDPNRHRRNVSGNQDPLQAAEEGKTGGRNSGARTKVTGDFYLRDVPSGLVFVDFDRTYVSHAPLSLLTLTLAQVAVFAYFAYFAEAEAAPSSSPSSSSSSFPPSGLAPASSTYRHVGGPESMWMRVVSDAPSCDDVRGEYWRLLSYAFVHLNGPHLLFNVAVQTFFATPVAIVHGNLAFLVIYFLGVGAGALAYATVGGGAGALVGCSSGVFCCAGMIVAELVVNWDFNALTDTHKHGSLDRWIRLGIISAVAALDVYLYLWHWSDAISYAAHSGGFLMGLLLGVAKLDPIEITKFERYLTPVAIVVALVAIVAGGLAHVAVYPPLSPFGGAFEYGVFAHGPCCTQLIHCLDAGNGDESIRRDEFRFFGCEREKQRLFGGNRTLESCGDMRSWADLQHR